MLNITKKQLETMYRSNTNKYCCKQLGVTQATLLKYLRLNDIEIKGTTKKKITIVKDGK